MQMPWRKKPQYVEWDLTGSGESGLGAIIYRSAAPMVVVKELGSEYRTYEEVAAAVAVWVATMPDEYRLNVEFERFKTLAHEMKDDGPPQEGLGYGKPPKG